MPRCDDGHEESGRTSDPAVDEASGGEDRDHNIDIIFVVEIGGLYRVRVNALVFHKVLENGGRFDAVLSHGEELGDLDERPDDRVHPVGTPDAVQLRLSRLIRRGGECLQKAGAQQTKELSVDGDIGWVVEYVVRDANTVNMGEEVQGVGGMEGMYKVEDLRLGQHTRFV